MFDSFTDVAALVVIGPNNTATTGQSVYEPIFNNFLFYGFLNASIVLSCQSVSPSFVLCCIVPSASSSHAPLVFELRVDRPSCVSVTLNGVERTAMNLTFIANWSR